MSYSEVGCVYDVLGLVAVLRDVHGQMVVWYEAGGDGGLGSRIVKDLRAEMAGV